LLPEISLTHYIQFNYKLIPNKSGLTNSYFRIRLSGIYYH